MKIRLKIGNREVEIDGAAAEVDALLTKWWAVQPELHDDSSAVWNRCHQNWV